MAELKSCPFCGGGAEFVLEGAIVGRVRCKCCKVTQVCLRPIGSTIESWNNRAENEELEFTRDFIREQGLEFALVSAWNRRAEYGK